MIFFDHCIKCQALHYFCQLVPLPDRKVGVSDRPPATRASPSSATFLAMSQAAALMAAHWGRVRVVSWSQDISSSNRFFVITLYCLNYFFWVRVLFIYRLIIATVIGIFYDPFWNWNQNLAKRVIYGTLGSKGFSNIVILKLSLKMYIIFTFLCWILCNKRSFAGLINSIKELKFISASGSFWTLYVNRAFMII